MPHPHHVNPRTGKKYGWEAEQARLKAESPEVKAQEIALLERQLKAVQAREDLLAFTQFTMPDPEAPGDVERTAYKAQPFHRKVADVLTKFERGDLRHEDGRPCKQIIFAMPPRHGKTQLATKHFSAWLSGRHPEWNVAVGTYSDGMAEDIGGDTRAILATPQFKQVFPDHKLRKGSTAKTNFQTEKGGRLVFVGRGGPLTGKGANCLPGDTEVETQAGPKLLKDVCVDEKVLSYDIARGRVVWRRVEAIAVRPRSRLYRITDTAGRVVEATADHRFYANAGWREASELAPGDSLVCAMRETGHETSSRGGEALQTGSDGLLLQQHMLGPGDEPETSRRAGVRPLRGASPTQELGRVAQDGPGVLLDSLHGGGTAGRTGRAGAVAAEAVRTVQRAVPTAQQREQVLLAGLRQPRALGAYAGREQPALEGWGVQTAHKAACGPAVSGDAPADLEARREPLCRVWRGRAAGSAPFGREPAEQHGSELGDCVQAVPREGAFFVGGASHVASVEDTCRDAVVYDIQVEETENFFANGVLVHNCLLIDDLYKDHEEARSQTIRDQAWNWFTKVAMTRRMGRKLVMLTMTRWHSDDVIGRLTDPENPCYNAIEAKNWMIIRIPAVAEEDDPLGREEGEPLWPEEFDLDFLQSQQRLDPLGFAALYQQRPTVADGILFRRENIQRYDPADLPDNLRYYCASDHAVGTKQRNDPSCFGKAGVDAQDNLWLTEIFWKRVPTDQAVEAMLAMGTGSTAPLLWWAERGHISQSIGPFLRKRMLETGTYINVVEVTPSVDKETRAQSIAARVAMGKVYIPKGQVWDRLVEEMLAFPNGIHDDGVDMLSLFGLGLQSQFGRRPQKTATSAPKVGTVKWLLDNDRRIERERQSAKVGKF